MVVSSHVIFQGERKPPLYQEGDTVGNLTIEEYIGLCREDRAKTYQCRCKCGKPRTVTERSLKNGAIWACNTCMKKDRVSPLIKDLTGLTVGPYKIIKKAAERDKARHVMWLCECMECHEQRLIRSDLLLKHTPPRCKCYWRKNHTIP